MNGEFVPDRGDLIWIEFMPQAGHEQSGRRPALVLSSKSYNLPRGLVVLCPISSRVGGYDFEVPLQSVAGISGVILSDQVKSMDWRARYAQHIGTAPQELVNEVVENIATLLGFVPLTN